MGKKSLKIKVDNLDDENYVNVAYEIVKTVKSAVPESNVSILGANPEVFESSSTKTIKGE